MELVGNCLYGLAPLGREGLAALAVALFLAGLAAGATHCAGMCAPFVLAQVTAEGGHRLAGGRIARLAGAALLPYHAGRLLGYALLGAVAGAGAGLVAGLTGLRLVLAGLLLVAALLMLAQAAERLGWHSPRLPAPSLPRAIERRVGALLASPGGGRGVLLGLLLSALPCGAIYAALAAAAASGSALGGAIGMASFAAGTAPGLVAVALVGGFLARRAGPLLRPAGALLLAVNGLLLGGMAVSLAV
ncbi:MAG: sulfite exporter TauE/SafE family protein [Rhodovarius sp.]|nr:sulfite exporter TauE/SafE family protein [Rhodovarius sp.]MCX8132587.1 sulfite exporter TauE/SafE family protein [Roseococcus sp.]MDW8314635.1 sulfite exporter TauE/SafE family protein [Rhodovarius sp.]